MPETIRLSLACTSSDRTRPIIDGRVEAPGVSLTVLPGEPEDIFRRALRDRAFDVTELSMGSHIVTTARGDAPYIGIPVFPSRAFRHSAIYVRTDRGIRGAADLAGKRIGLPEYQQTAALWVRGILREHYGVDTRGIAWRTGGMEEAGLGERVALKLPPDLDVRPIGPGETLNALLAAGEIDAVVGPRPPSCFVARSAPVDRLYPDYRTEEESYFRATGFFPIMHCVALRKELAAEHPWLPLELFRSFAKARALALSELSLVNVLRVSLPWIAAEAEAQSRIMGGDPWPYGFRRNREEVAAMIRFAAADGLTSRNLQPEELFHPSVLDAAP
ncbi:ABC transporter substrate-binding protein [Roseomonas sp. SSH11]|uniref:ABC transporter substrate-binding protein n=1 Tax=Pararoseomonas baculiformis TaxID=2820812 RepID=A0ABS4AIV1_9PROT|nr:ABC transporter substrate-binding protein [Pararoseomonas baculiformis]MBP0446952.1 ABC transporter substrate-binding protein [Pararoseomonas baculiformis]